VFQEGKRTKRTQKSKKTLKVTVERILKKLRHKREDDWFAESGDYCLEYEGEE